MPREIPKSVSILGITYEVRRKSLPDGEDGYIVPRKQRIVVDSRSETRP